MLFTEWQIQKRNKSKSKNKNKNKAKVHWRFLEETLPVTLKD